ncbi:MAG: class I SAM-dependent methyltransferase [Bacteroidetes bacterium]|jgi:ubiquinone/menaquinone biosynthesis C-methylase UbiE|nr:class I SAM-dependent methyltransferase [Bacteroidota bacterium]MBT3748455.1 class I SAM-dependent methyltransferase [Bacteroidota bacterium]MBT4397841.1 class I SAM-dependent methyltransferase [Bacteroidota bacterium]MBT4411093.1 class I SAM-dependent methyltransferase [Bacteroidota bacterium]MBT5426561.1 class I SAM-dependent methyltransferase [Bacteroidota bacterium]
MTKVRNLMHLNKLIWLGLLTYVVLPAFKTKGRRFSKKLNKIWFDSLAIVMQNVSESSADFMNYGYVTHPNYKIEDIQDTPRNMYLHIATNGNKEDLSQKKLLEIGCGKGAGGVYMKEKASLHDYTGVDLSDEHIKMANEKISTENGIRFIQGDAENLPIADEKFDFVLNIESSHQYPNIIKFYKEVKRVLEAGGQFMYVDFFDANEVEACEKAALDAGLVLKKKDDITKNVCWALEKTSDTKTAKIQKGTPKFVHRFVKEWAGTIDSPLYRMLMERKRHYIHYVYTN